MGKVLDRIQSSCLLQHLVQYNLISPHQFGFIPGKSTTIYLIHRWLQALEIGHNITAVFLDFKKAFDRVWHHGLLHKLLICGISPKSVAWISSYLKGKFAPEITETYVKEEVARRTMVKVPPSNSFLERKDVRRKRQSFWQASLQSNAQLHQPT